MMALIGAKRLVDRLGRAGFVVMKRPAIGGGRNDLCGILSAPVSW